jgi:hypothetical protein
MSSEQTLVPLSEDELNKLAQLAIGAKEKSYSEWQSCKVEPSLVLDDYGEKSRGGKIVAPNFLAKDRWQKDL